MLRIAVPNKGALSQAADEMLREAGYRQRRHAKELMVSDEPNGVQFFYLRPRDIATYVDSGDLDLGITGRDLLIDSGAAASEVLDLEFARSTFRFAARPGRVRQREDLNGARIATSFPGVVRHFLDQHGLHSDVVKLDGAVENAVELGVAEIVADVVETGATLRQAGLEVCDEVVMQSTAIVIQRRSASTTHASAHVVQRLRSVLVARKHVMIAYDVPVDSLEQAVALTPGIESPTVSQLHREGWVAVQAMALRSSMHAVMDELHSVGARGILATDIRACRI